MSCNPDSEKECLAIKFGLTGNMLDTIAYCVPKNDKCDCTRGTNAKECTIGADYGDERVSCIHVDEFCPCKEPTPHACPMPVSFDSDGYWESTQPTDVDVPCASEFADCPLCGKNAHLCVVQGYSYCEPNIVPCPVQCKAGEKLCEVADYTTEGKASGFAKECVAATATCPCGKNAMQCTYEGSITMCVPTSMDVC